MLRAILLLPLFNLLIFIYAVLPVHDLGLTIILFTLVVRIALWPLLKKQLHQQKAMRELQPEIIKIKKKAKGNKQKEAAMMMELYKEREVNPLSTIGILLIQLPILIALFVMLQQLLGANEPAELQQYLQNNTYGFIKSLGFMADLIAHPENFNATLFGLDLRNPNIALAALAAFAQYLQSKGLQPKKDDSKKLRDILKDAKAGKAVDQSEQTAAVARSASTFLPILTFVFGLQLPAALSLYWAAGGFIATVQQQVALREEVSVLSRLVPRKKVVGEPLKKGKP